MESSVNFEDNYEFYMYHLNNTGQLITPMDQTINPANAKKLVAKKPSMTQASPGNQS